MTTSPMPTITGPRAQWVGSWAQQCEAVARLVQDEPVGPLDFDLVVVPSAGHRRALSQALAIRPTGPALTAGIEFVTTAGLFARLADVLTSSGRLSEDRWQGVGLELAILELAADPTQSDALAPLLTHLGAPGGRPGRSQATATRLAGLLRRYARQHPDMVHGWREGGELGPDGVPLAAHDRWQAALWRGLCGLLGTDPAERFDALVTELAAAPVPGLPGRVIFCQVDDPDAQQTRLREGLANHHQVEIIALAGIATGPDRSGNAFLRHHASRAAVQVEWSAPAGGGLLAKVQDEITTDQAPRPRDVADPSFQIHACHGPDRQVEVLRDVLCGLFTDDPTLQPRDVVVLCPDLAEYAPLISASFGLDPGSATGFHPGHRLRAQLAAPWLALPNPVLGSLIALYRLHIGRATSVDLLDFCLLPPIGRRFGFDDAERLQTLIDKAGIRWGLDGDHRRRNGVDLAQGTWIAGVQRLSLALALDEAPPVSLGTTTPASQITSSDAQLIGRLAELVSRVRKLAAPLDSAQTAAQWANWMTQAIDLLVAVDPDDQWQLVQAHAEIADFAEQSAGRTTPLEGADLIGWLTERLAAAGRRPNYGNGSLLFTKLDDLATIEAKVVAILGLDDAHFPGSPQVDGDDLLLRPGTTFASHWTTDQRRVHRQRLLDALLAAQQSFIVITKGADEATGVDRPTPICIAELIDACAIEGDNGGWRRGAGEQALVNWHPMHPHGAADFVEVESSPPSSFDQQGLAGAKALRSVKQPVVAASHAIHVAPEETELPIEDLSSFFANPARGLLRAATGTHWSSFDTELKVELPLGSDRLLEWQMGDELLGSLLADHDLGAATRRAWLSGAVLPGDVGRQVIEGQSLKAQQIAASVAQFRAGRQAQTDCEIEVAGVRLHGRVHTSDGWVAVHRFGHPNAKQALDCWLRMLLLAACDPTAAGAPGLLIGTRTWQIEGCPTDLARELLDDLVRLRTSGLQRLLPLPSKSASAYADVLSWEKGTPLDRAKSTYERFTRDQGPTEGDDPNWRYFFDGFDELIALPPEPNDPATHLPSRFASLADWMWGTLARRLRRLDGLGGDR